MMYGDLFPAARAAALSQRARRPYQEEPGPGVWQGFGGALADAIPYAANTSASFFAEVLDAYGKAAAYRDAPTVAAMHGEEAPDPSALEAKTIGRLGESDVAREFRERARSHAPDPLAVGMAGQIAHGVVSGLAKAGVYTVTAGPAAPVLFGADLGVNRAKELTDEGVDAGTATSAGLTTGVLGAAGMRLPAAFGATRLQSAALGAAVNPALNATEMALIRGTLEHADYEKIAERFDPFDPVSLAVAGITGGAFGAAFHGKANAPKTKTPPKLTPDQHAAALTMHETAVRDGDTLTRPGDVAAANTAKDAQTLARQQLDAGETVGVAERVAVEQEQLDAAYQRVLESPAGDAFDPLVRITPEDIEGVIVARGGMKGLNDLEVKGSGWGLVKFIWKHGEESETNPEYRITRGDILAFPQVIREFEPSRPAAEDGSLGREWRVLLPDDNDNPRTVVFADNLISGRKGRHLVTVYVQEPTTSGWNLPLSKRIAADQNPAAEVGSPTADTAPAVSHPDAGGSEQPLAPTIAQPELVQEIVDAANRILGREEPAPAPDLPKFKPDTPEQARMLEMSPDTLLPTGEFDAEGNPVHARLADLLQELEETEQQAKTESAVFEAAVNCAMRYPNES